MIGATLLSGGAAKVHALLPLAVQGPDSPLGDLMGYVFLFIVVIWPIIRGVLEQAQTKRAEFERQSRKERGERPRGRTLEELLEGDPYAEAFEEPVVRRPEPPPLPPKSRAPAEEVSRPWEDEARPSERELVGDPFDDSSMGLDLVDDSALVDVPTEDELETSIGETKERTTLKGLEEDARPAASVARGASPSERSLARLERRFTPWQRAFVLKELLGPPTASRPFGQRNL